MDDNTEIITIQDLNESKYKNKNKKFGYTNNPKYFNKKSDYIEKDLNEKKFSFKGKKKFKHRKRPKKFIFKKHKHK